MSVSPVNLHALRDSSVCPHMGDRRGRLQLSKMGSERFVSDSDEGDGRKKRHERRS